MAITPTKCPLCEFSAKRITVVEKHIAEEHNMSPKEAYDSVHGNVMCKCGCGNETTFINVKHGYPSSLLKGHNGNIYKLYDAEKAAEISEKRKSKLRGKTSWAKGLTKETDERIKLRGEATAKGRKKAFEEGKIKIWSKGLTKETDERVLQLSEQIKVEFNSGKRKSWHKGLTEETDERVALKNQKLRARYKNGELKPWHKGLNSQIDPRLNKAWKSRDPQKEYAHIRWTNDEITEMLQLNTQIKLKQIDSYKNEKKPALWMKCNMCDWFEKTSLVFAKNDRCPRCTPEGSNLQHKIADWIASQGVKLGRNVRGLIGRQELDIFIPIKSIGIEVNGLYWHNEPAGKDSKYHQGKSDSCTKVGIDLIHVFEDEWHEKQDIIKSIILNRLGKNTKRVFARKCKVVSVTTKQRKDFFNENHLEGDVQSTIAFGLMHENNLVSAVSLRRPFHKKYSDVIEVARSSSALNTTVVGGVSKLIKHAKTWARSKNYKKMITYVDYRFGKGKSYVNAGFTQIDETAPRFWWTDCTNRFNRFKYRADKSRGMSEAQVADEAGVMKIWGCKNLLFELVL